jgi:signal transduction histidine kinase/CheY-like chemotaxis protein
MSRLSAIITLVWCTLVPFFARAQAEDGIRPVTERYTTQNGLTHNHVYQVFQDSRGFIWLVTGDALILYDGSIFMPVMRWEVIKSSGTVRLLFEDVSGKIWLRKGTNSYILIDIRSFEITDLKQLLGDRLQVQIDCVVKDKKGIISIFSLKNGLYRYNSLKDDLQFLGFGDHDGENVDGDGNTLWFFSELVNTSTVITSLLDLESMKSSPVNLKTQLRLKVMSNGRMGGGDNTGLIILNRDAKVNVKRLDGYNTPNEFNISLINCTTPEIAEENGRYCWLFYKGSLLRIDIQNDYTENFTQMYGLGSLPMVFDVLRDRQGIYWIATSDGLIKTSKISNRFRRYFWEDTERLKMAPRNSCRGISEARNGDVYLGFSENLYRKREKETVFSKVASFGVAIIDVQVSDEQEAVWLGSGYLIRYNITRKKTDIIHRPDHVKLGEHWSVYEDKDKVWLGYSTDLMYLDKHSGKIYSHSNPGVSGDLANTDIYQIVPVQGKDSLWMVTSRGLFLFDRERKIIGSYGTGDNSPVRFPCDNIRHIHQSSPEQMWLATSCGLIDWNPKSGAVRLISARDGLPNTNLYAVYPDDFGFLWMSSDMGIIQYHVASGRVRHFTVREGVTDNEFNRISHLKARDGTIYFGSINGATSFHPADFSDDFFTGSTASLVLLSADAQGPNSGEVVDLLPEYVQKGRIVIKADERFVRLHFAVPNYSVSGNIHYFYKIEGVHNSWQQAPTPDVMFPQLPGGKYRIFFRTGSTSGISSIEPAIIEMEIMPHFYEETWFYLLILAVLAVLGAFAWKIRIRILLASQRLLEDKIEVATSTILSDKKLIEVQMNRIANISEEKNRFFVNITHELRTPLTLITAPLEELQKKKLSPKREAYLLDTAARNSRQLLLLINDLLLLSKDEQIKTGSLDQPVKLVPLIEEIIGLHSFGASQKGLRFYFVRGEVENPVIAGDEKLIRRVLVNIVANAVKYSKDAGKITISLSCHDDVHTVSVADNGRGIDAIDLPHIFERYYQTQRMDIPFEGGTGIGLSIAREIMDIHKGNIRVESEPGKGSTFHLDFPVMNGDPANETDMNSVPVLIHGAEIPPAGTEKRWRIMVVDDNPEMGMFISEILGPDFDVSVHFSADSVLSSLTSYPLPEVLICDLMMPTMNGFQLIEEIRQTAAFEKLKILALTAMSGPDVAEQVSAAGADGIVWKPFTRDILKSQILELVTETSSSDILKDYVQTFAIERNLSEEQTIWLNRLSRLCIADMAQSDFSVDKLAEDMHASRSTFFRELAKLTGQTPNEYIQGIRLEYARALLEAGEASSVACVLSKIGLKDKTYFSRMYKDRFGKSPHTYFQKAHK